MTWGLQPGSGCYRPFATTECVSVGVSVKVYSMARSIRSFRPSKELTSREDTLIKLQQQLEKLEALLQDKDDVDARYFPFCLNKNISCFYAH